ncbi:MAG TPA: hypothetical protein VIC26_12670 [Marinagarivorans sp.]
MQTGFPSRPPSVIPEFHAVWSKTSTQALSSLVNEARSHNIPNSQLKLILRSLAQGEPRRLADSIMRGYESKLSVLDKRNWQAQYNIPYPY